MGICKLYFPTEMAVSLAKIANAHTFVETGTHLGGTTKWASAHFEVIHTIEFFRNIKILSLESSDE